MTAIRSPPTITLPMTAFLLQITRLYHFAPIRTVYRGSVRWSAYHVITRKRIISPITSYLIPLFQVLAIEDASDKGILFLATNIGLVSFQKGDKKLHIDPTLKHLTINTICRIKDELLLGTSQGAYLYSIHTKKTKKYSLNYSIRQLPVSSITLRPKTTG